MRDLWITASRYLNVLIITSYWLFFLPTAIKLCLSIGVSPFLLGFYVISSMAIQLVIAHITGITIGSIKSGDYFISRKATRVIHAIIISFILSSVWILSLTCHLNDSTAFLTIVPFAFLLSYLFMAITEINNNIGLVNFTYTLAKNRKENIRDGLIKE